ncbi:hypothetical protein [Sphingobacterium lumbrici]|uniref:hypothetical protein n=1 Tax=Sphingobacterium lumbrici TaxID=2559600 RepID=UPI001125CF69|nr:hypothetical protein [Sphingobacterium lumbrici]
MYILSDIFWSYIQQPETREQTPTYLLDIADLLPKEDTEKNDVDKILESHAIQSFEDIKLQCIDLLLSYANHILEDSAITETEAYDFAALKRLFRIREGEFLQYRSFQVKEILKKEFIRIYSDHFVDRKEELEKVNLQALFDLSYDQFEEIKKDEVINALLNGADPLHLDIAKIPKGFNVI